MKHIKSILLGSLFLFSSLFANEQDNKSLHPAIEIGASRTSFKYNDYISSRFKNVDNKVLMNLGGFIEIHLTDMQAIALGLRYVQMASTADYYFVEPYAFRGKLETTRDYLSFSVKFKNSFNFIRPSPFLYIGAEQKFLILEEKINTPSHDYQKRWDYDNDPLFCDDCGMQKMRMKLSVCYGFGFAFNLLKKTFYLQYHFSYGMRSSEACFDYNTREDNISVGLKF